MLLHVHDPSFKRLKGCWKRASKEGVMDGSHPLSPAFHNMLMMLDAVVDDGEQTTWEMTEEALLDMKILDWFAWRVDEYCKNHLVSDDSALSWMLSVWKQRMPFNPLLIK